MKCKSLPIVVIALLASMLFAEKAFAGAWTVPKYKVWAQEYIKWNYAKGVFTQDWKYRTITGFGANALRSWDFDQVQEIDYGVTDWFNLQWGMEEIESHWKEYDRSPGWGGFERKNHGFKNVMLGLKYQVLKVPVVVSGQTRFFIYPGEYGVWHTDDANFSNQPTIGFGENSIEQRILVSKKFFEKAKFPCYVNLETGYRWNNRHVCNSWVYFGETGVWLTKNVIAKTELDGMKSHDGTGSLNEQAYGIWRIGGIWAILAGDPIERKGKQFNVEFTYGMTLWGKNATANEEFVIKAYTQF